MQNALHLDQLQTEKEILLKKRIALFKQLSEVEEQIRSINTRLDARPAELSTHKFLCSCGEQFDYYLVRLSHIADNSPDPEAKHRDAGEILNGKKCFRDSSISGNPIVKSVSNPRPRTKSVSVDDLL